VNVSVSKPVVALQAAFLQMLDDYEAHDPENAGHYKAARSDFGEYVQSLHDDERGLIGVVPCSHRWLVESEGAIVGVVRVRHQLLTGFLADEVGHIGYDVPPAWRGRGLGVAALNAGLDHARELGLGQVLLYADTDNPASWRTIERCGGVLESEHVSPHYGCLVRRYSITLESTYDPDPAA
jgi:predicted acetyltransferase